MSETRGYPSSGVWGETVDLWCCECDRTLGTLELRFDPTGEHYSLPLESWRDADHWRYAVYPIGYEWRCLLCAWPNGAEPRLLASLAGYVAGRDRARILGARYRDAWRAAGIDPAEI